jgi:hypothetical protein
MSRGLGKLQRFLFGFIKTHPLTTFAELLGGDDGELAPHVIRSARRALRKLIDDGAVVTVGAGGPREPYRYSLSPMLFAMAGDKEAFEQACKDLESTAS